MLFTYKTLEYLGMIINTINMTVSLTQKKKAKIFDFCLELLNHIRDVAKLLGYMSNGFLAVKFGKMH